MFSLHPTPSHSPIKTGSPYSHFVNFMRVLLPVIAILIMVAIVTWPKFRDNPKQFGLGIADNISGDNAAHELVNPRYTGLDKNKQPFSITAESASPKEGSPSRISLSNPKADFLTGDGAWMALSAAEGTYDIDKRELKLEGAVNLFHDKGHEIKTSGVKIEFNKNTAYSSKSVEGQGPMGNIAARGFLIEGGKYFFKGPASVLIKPNLEKR